MVIQAFTPIIARQSTVAKDLRQTRRAERAVVPPALPAFSAFSASIMERLLRREAGLWERFSLQYKQDEENGDASPVQIHTQNNITLRFLLDHLKTEVRTQRGEARLIPADKTPAPTSQKQEANTRFPVAGRMYSPAMQFQAFRTLQHTQTQQLSFAENTYYRQLLSMTAACTAAPMRTLPISGIPSTGMAMLPTREERMAAQIISGVVRTELTHFTAEETPIPRDMSMAVQTLKREIAALDAKSADVASSRKQNKEKDAPISATIRALSHKAASAAIEQGITARQHVRQTPQPVLRQIQAPAATVRFVPPAYVDPFGGKRPMGKLEWTDFGYQEDGAAPMPVARKASPAPLREDTAQKPGLQPSNSMRTAAQQWGSDELVPLSTVSPQTEASVFSDIQPQAAQMAAPAIAAEQTPLTMVQTALAEASVSKLQESQPVSTGSANSDAASRGAVQPGADLLPTEEPTYLAPQVATGSILPPARVGESSTQPPLTMAYTPQAEEAEAAAGSHALRGAIQPGSVPATDAPTYLSPRETPPMTGSVLPVEDERAADAAHFFETYAQLYPEAAQDAASPLMRGSVLPGRMAAYTAPETAYLENAAQNYPRRNRVHSLNNEYNVQQSVPQKLDAKAIGKITDEVFERIDKRIRNERRRYGL